MNKEQQIKKINRKEMQKCIDEMDNMYQREERVQDAYRDLKNSFGARCRRWSNRRGCSVSTNKVYYPTHFELLYNLKKIQSIGEIRNVYVSIDSTKYHGGKCFSEVLTRNMFTRWMNKHYPSILA